MNVDEVLKRLAAFQGDAARRAQAAPRAVGRDDVACLQRRVARPRAPYGPARLQGDRGAALLSNANWVANWSFVVNGGKPRPVASPHTRPMGREACVW